MLASAAWLFATGMHATPASAAGAYPKYLPPCKPVVVINVRGSGQAGPKTLGKPWHGMPQEDPGRTVLSDLASLVGQAPWAGFSLTDLPYEAIKVDLLSSDWYLFDYDVSRKDGEGTIGLLLSALSSRCPGAQVVLVGYSQGADAIGEQLPRVPLDLRKKIVGVALFGDPRFSPGSRAAKGSFNPNRSGIRGRRPEFPGDVAVGSWCRSLDPVCQGLVGYRIVQGGIGGLLPVIVTEGADIGSHTHYQDNEAHKAAQWLRALLSKRGLLNLPPPTASLTPLDVSFVIDSTGSMSDAISSVRDNVADIRAQLAAQSSAFQAALTEYRDEPDEDSDFQARLLTDLTPDATAFAAALAQLDADGGGDTAESVFAGVNQGLSVAWRPGSSKAVVLIGDAPPKDPEPVTGSTSEQTARRANLLGIPIHSMVVDNDGETVAAFGALSAKTSGTTTSVDDPSLVAQTIVATLQRNAGAPSAVTTRSAARARRSATATATIPGGYVGVPTLLSAAASDSPLGDTLTYTWDFGDGTAAFVTSPVVAHIWAQPFVGDVTLTVTDTAGRTARIVQPVAIFAGGPRAVSPPTRVRVQRRPGRLRLSWARPKIGAPVSYEVVLGGRILGVLRPGKEQPRYSLTLAKPTRCKPLRLKIVAVDALGRRAASAATNQIIVKPRRFRFARLKGKRVLLAVDGRCKPK